MTLNHLKMHEMAPVTSETSPISQRSAESSVMNPLSFSRSAVSLLRKRFGKFETLRLKLDERGRGEALYRLTLDEWVFHFFVLSQELPEDQKLDRNFAGSWDVMGAFCEGKWTAEREVHLRHQIPLQRAGRADHDTLIYARGNRSGRLFNSVVDALAAGRQPNPASLAEVGYILRTTAFIGNGHLGTKTLAAYAGGHPLSAPYHAQMCSGLLLREFVFDLVDAMAARRAPSACRLATPLRRFLGLGNSAATGLVPFLTSHPKLVSTWLVGDQIALAEIKRLPPNTKKVEHFSCLIDRAILHLEQASRRDDGVFLADAAIAAELREVATRLGEHHSTWADQLDGLSAGASCEVVSVIEGLLLEVEPEVINRYLRLEQFDESLAIDPGTTTDDLLRTMKKGYGWAIEAAQRPGSGRFFWYRASGAPRDLRRGLRGRVPKIEFETPMDLVPKVGELVDALDISPTMPLADFLVSRPELRATVARIQTLKIHPAGEMAIDFSAAEFSPFAPIRQILTLFGLDKIEAVYPKSVRGTFLQGAPLVEEIWRTPCIPAEWPYCSIPTDEVIKDTPPRRPMQFPTFTAPTEPTNLSSALSRLRVAPNEISNAFEAVMQASGTALGVAMPASLVAASLTATSPDVLQALLEELLGNEGTLGQLMQGAPDDLSVTFEAGGSHLLKALVPALDLARDRAVRFGHAMVAIQGAAETAMSHTMLSHCVEAGPLYIWSWHPADSSWLAERARANGWISEAFLDDTSALVLAWSDPEGLDPEFFSQLAQMAAANQLIEATALTSGVDCSKEAFQNLQKHASRLFVPPEIEARLRDEEIDPLTIF